MNRERFAAGLALVTTLTWIPNAASAIDRDAAGHSDAPLWDHFLIVEGHWIELDGTATIVSPCGERVLDFHLAVRGH